MAQPPYLPGRLPVKRWKRWLVVVAGHCARLLLPTRASTLVSGAAEGRPAMVDRLILASLIDQGLRAGSIDHLSPLHLRYWACAEVADFHAGTHARDWFDQACHDIPTRLRAAIASGAPVTTCCEIGCGTGEVLEYLAERLGTAGVAQYIGLDLSAEQCRRNAARCDPARFRFVAVDATAWIPVEARPGWMVFTVGGVFEYFTRDALKRLFAILAARQALLCLIEPIAVDHDLATDVGSRPYGHELALSHNYPVLVHEAGFALLHREERMIDAQRWVVVIARAAGA